MDQDESALLQWSEQFQLFASQQAHVPIASHCCWGSLCVLIFPWQGALDMKYLEDRFHKGKARVKQLLAEKHILTSHTAVNMAHGDVVQKQADLGRSTFLN